MIIYCDSDAFASLVCKSKTWACTLQQVSGQMDAFGDHDKLREEYVAAETRSRKLRREQVTISAGADLHQFFLRVR